MSGKKRSGGFLIWQFGCGLFRLFRKIARFIYRAHRAAFLTQRRIAPFFITDFYHLSFDARAIKAYNTTVYPNSFMAPFTRPIIKNSGVPRGAAAAPRKACYMKIQIIVDSCCDTTPAMRNALGLISIPLKITVDGNKEYVDDASIDILQMLADMKASSLPVSTACPSPEEYADAMRSSDASVVVTLSHHLSGSYNSAQTARSMVLEETPDKQIAIFDSKSASAGELRIAFFLHELIAAGASFDEICEQTPPFINRMRTLFVLEDLGNLIKNGRIPKMAGMLGTVLMLRPIMGENGEGEIIPLEKVRGTQKALDRLVEMIAQRTAALAAKSLQLVLSHCNCPERGAALKKKILQLCPAVGEVILVPTGGLSSCYANDGGIILAFA